MKYQESPTLSFLLDENHFMYNCTESPNRIDLFLKSRSHSCCCPFCGEISSSIHSTYSRLIQDSPIHCKQTYLHYNVFKYNCLNTACPHKTFTETLPFAGCYQVRTDALNTLILGVAIYLSNIGASKILQLLGVIISKDSIQRLYNRIQVVDNPDVEAIGVDDVAKRKGQSYATAIYDMEDHHLLALLDGRDSDTLKGWLKQHRKVRLVARDRASAYASAINEILPECTQVADRFHLLHNLLGYLKDIFRAQMPAEIFIKNNFILEAAPPKVLRERKPDDAKLASLHYDNTPPQTPDGKKIHYDNKKHNLNNAHYKAHKENRLKKQRLVRQIQSAWHAMQKPHLKTIAQQFHIAAPTAKKYVQMSKEQIDSMESITPYKKHDSCMNDYLNIIYKMLADGQDGVTIYHYIVRNGYHANQSSLQQYIYLLSKNNFPKRNLGHDLHLMEAVYPEGVVVIKRREILKFLLTNKEKKGVDKTIESYIELIQSKFPIVSQVKDAFSSFHTVIMGDDPAELDKFLDKYAKSRISAFCNGIKKDIAPVKNAISLDVSSGFVEGNNNKFKLLKRIVYGRSGLVNLFKKCYVAFLPKEAQFHLSDLL